MEPKITSETWVFDLDGTLVDSFAHYFRCLEYIFEKYGVAFHEGLRYPALTDQLMLFLREHLGEINAELAMAELREISKTDATEILPFPGVVEILETLKARGARMAVWTNRDFPSAQAILEHSGLSGYFDAFISGSCVTDRKPHPEGLNRIIETLECDIESVTMVGDHEHDVLGAKSVTARAVRASWHTYWEIEKCAHADVQFYSVTEFAEWVENGPALKAGATPAESH